MDVLFSNVLLISLLIGTFYSHKLKVIPCPTYHIAGMNIKLSSVTVVHISVSSGSVKPRVLGDSATDEGKKQTPFLSSIKR